MTITADRGVEPGKAPALFRPCDDHGQLVRSNGHDRRALSRPTPIALCAVAKALAAMAACFSSPLDDFVGQVVPLNQKRGLVRKDYTASTLRDHIGEP